MNTLALKLILTPTLIAAASLAGRRWGTAVSGWLVGLPLTSGPITLFLALSHGASFAAAAATGVLAGAISQAAFCLAYGWLALRAGWPLTVAVACLAFAAATFALHMLTLPPVPLFLVVVAALALSLRLLPRAVAKAPRPAKSGLPSWDLPVRMVVATAFVVLLTEAAPILGPHLTGLLAPFPLYAAILAIFAQQQQGPAAAIGVLRGLLLGLFAFAGFFLTLALLLGHTGIASAFVIAILVTLTIQSGTLWALRRASRPLAVRVPPAA
ncbi:MAG: hypothetical protein OJF49_003398 [Ktedonobacterales bacterium]|jgi:hypothetical protein|nr:MAG: hypothetical protein OJF49_003398 [Ktedonobacterales bacterium]